MSIVTSEPAHFAVSPGRVLYLPNPLNHSDKKTITLDFSPFLGSDTISSVAWAADNGVTVGDKSNTTTAVTASLTAGTVEGTRRAECVATLAGGDIRTVAVEVEIENLR